MGPVRPKGPPSPLRMDLGHLAPWGALNWGAQCPCSGGGWGEAAAHRLWGPSSLVPRFPQLQGFLASGRRVFLGTPPILGSPITCGGGVSWDSHFRYPHLWVPLATGDPHFLVPPSSSSPSDMDPISGVPQSRAGISSPPTSRLPYFWGDQFPASHRGGSPTSVPPTPQLPGPTRPRPGGGCEPAAPGRGAGGRRGHGGPGAGEAGGAARGAARLHSGCPSSRR